MSRERPGSALFRALGNRRLLTEALGERDLAPRLQRCAGDLVAPPRRGRSAGMVLCPCSADMTVVGRVAGRSDAVVPARSVVLASCRWR